MNESYNPYEVAPMSRADAAAAPRPERDAIDALRVSATWKRRFRLIDKAGGPELPHLRDLTFGERMSINFSVLGFFFGPIYYLCKGLWRPAIAYFGVAFLIAFIAALAGLDFLGKAAGYGSAAVYAMRAGILYYRKKVLGEEPWF
ncbi:DUF2628 domain-containing protein [Lysobacter changpingensis]|uniref:DUF2628 domain-containing protein n=1 Tax=Lysobacter changpingensis TaxID=2792784 RepID=UPI002A4E1672|nr:DUF2628 domain-containing protein [Lysobacter changpingensis]